MYKKKPMTQMPRRAPSAGAENVAMNSNGRANAPKHQTVR